MARKTNHRFARRKREQARQERAAARRARKQGASSSPGSPGPEGDIDDIVVGPQPKDKISEAEVALAVERAMSPGSVRQRVARKNRHEAVGKRLFVGNLDFGTDEAELRDLFKDKGFAVVQATIVKDRDTGRPRGFAFVELAEPEEAVRAIEAFDGTEFGGRELRVNPAEQRQA